jgi:stage II sporulation protein E
MQYGAEIFPYERIKKVNNDEHRKKEYNIEDSILFFYKLVN